MTEYIYDWTPNKQHRKEEIVRCKDCVWFSEANELFATDDWCRNFGCEVEPDGFCKWGEGSEK